MLGGFLLLYVLLMIKTLALSGSLENHWKVQGVFTVTCSN